MRQTSLPLENLQAWSIFNGVQLRGATVTAHIKGDDGLDHGGGLLSNAQHDGSKPLLAVPLDLVLSKDRVEECAKTDLHLRSLVDAASALFQNPRTAVVLYLIYQMTINTPEAQDKGIGVDSPFSDYVKLLPKDIPLPTFYSEAERQLLKGTSLHEALEQKLLSLENEFDRLKECTTDVRWCQEIWWDEQPNSLDLEDWKLADAMYRSRALELPRSAVVGMVPVLDMANHSADDRYNARFEVDDHSEDVLLVVRDEKTIGPEDEITIMYGCGGACEMIFSYGFVDDSARSAREIFLSLAIGSDDPLRRAKIEFAKEAPGVRIYVDDKDQVRWDSTFVWWACTNEEDGLDFRLERTVDGNTELQATWKDEELKADDLQAKLLQDPLRDVFLLRTTITIQQRVEEQGTRLAESEQEFTYSGGQAGVRGSVYKTIGKLRELELELLTRAYEELEKEKAYLLESAVVREYLIQQQTEAAAGEVEDFS